MGSVRTLLGAVTTVFWIAAIVHLAVRDSAVPAKVSPNEWGDSTRASTTIQGTL